MKHSVSHSLGKEMAQKATRKAFESYVERFKEYNAKADWSTDSHAKIGFSIKGASIGGTVDVSDSSIDIDLSIPFLLRPFKDMALGKVEGEIKDWIGKAERGEID